MAKAREDVLLAYKMNDVDLTAEHGFPLRAIVPGWYAVASIKWLQRIIVTDRPFNGYYQTIDYAFWKRDGEHAELVPLREMQTKAEIAQPKEGDIVPGQFKRARSRRGLDERGRNHQKWKSALMAEGIGWKRS